MSSSFALLENFTHKSSSFAVKDEGGVYEIGPFLGDLAPICQVFRANYNFTGKNTDDQRRRYPQYVALKLAWVDDSDDFKNLKQEVENSFRIPQDDDDQGNNNLIILGIYKHFYYRGFLCVSMPFFHGGSLRYIIDDRILDWKLPEVCIAVVLREVLTGLCFLHRRGRVHTQLNAGNIFLGNFLGRGIVHDYTPGPATIKLGYQGSTYFHCPEANFGRRVMYMSWIPGDPSSCVASHSQGNRFWSVLGIYEPSSRGMEQNYTPKSDIWNLGVTALELAFGPFLENLASPVTGDDLRTEDEFRTFLTNLCSNQGVRLPNLAGLFLHDPVPTTPTARKIWKGLLNFVKGLKEIILGPDSGSEEESSEEGNPQIRDRLSDSFKAMVKKCLVFEPDARPTAEELLTDPFFAKYKDIDLDRFKMVMLGYDPVPPKLRRYREDCVRLMLSASAH